MSNLDNQFVSKAKDLRSKMKETEKRVEVFIPEKTLETLKKQGYSLCFAKKVGDYEYNVVWKSLDNYLQNNVFSWQPIYQIFGTNEFKENVKVSVSTNNVDIGLGETTTLNSAGNLMNPVTEGPETSINVINEYRWIHFGISQLSKNADGEMESTPIYVSKNKMEKGTASFTPVEKVAVWFQSNAYTSTMFVQMETNHIELDLTGNESAKVKYENGKWSKI